MEENKKDILEFTDEEIRLLNTREGYRNLLKPKNLDVKRALRRVKYEYKLMELQTEMIKMQQWVYDNKKGLVIIAEGRDAAGKGGAIRRMSEHLNPRKTKIVALPKPEESELGQWYFQRYVSRLPKTGEIVFFNRSWYNRAVVEPVNDFCTKEQYEMFMSEVNLFEDMLINDGLMLIKLYFSITKEQQKKRIKAIAENPLKRWKLSPVDLRAIELWDEYTKYRQRMIDETSTARNPWIVIDANRKTDARIAAIQHVLKKVPYKNNFKA
jgi:polyphosphate kinase 2